MEILPQQRQRRPRRKVLTDAMVAALPRRPKPYFHPDPELPKHGIRVRPTGPGAYTVITRDPFGKQRWTKTGSTAEKTIGEARDIARVVIGRVEQGSRRSRRRSRRATPSPRSRPNGSGVTSTRTSCAARPSIVASLANTSCRMWATAPLRR
jgi:hypothetical protein